MYTPILLSESNSFGFRGEGMNSLFGGHNSAVTQQCFFAALASAAELCCLEISSRDASARESWSVIVKVSHGADF